jgi:transcriptional regulator with XRE-family HTH domain
MLPTALLRAVVEDVSARLAVRLRSLRLAAGLTQAALAQRARVTSETVARLERVVRQRASANVNPSLDTLVRLAAALSVDVSELLRSSEAPAKRNNGLSSLLSGASPETCDRVLRVAEVLVREDHTAKQRAHKRRTKPRRE